MLPLQTEVKYRPRANRLVCFIYNVSSLLFSSLLFSSLLFSSLLPSRSLLEGKRDKRKNVIFYGSGL